MLDSFERIWTSGWSVGRLGSVNPNQEGSSGSHWLSRKNDVIKSQWAILPRVLLLWRSRPARCPADWGARQGRRHFEANGNAAAAFEWALRVESGCVRSSAVQWVAVASAFESALWNESTVPRPRRHCLDPFSSSEAEEPRPASAAVVRCAVKRVGIGRAKRLAERRPTKRATRPWRRWLVPRGCLSSSRAAAVAACVLGASLHCEIVVLVYCDKRRARWRQPVVSSLQSSVP